MLTVVSQIEDTQDLKNFIENNIQDEIAEELLTFNDEVFDFILSMFEESNISNTDLADFFRFEAYNIMKGFKIINTRLWSVTFDDLIDLQDIIRDTVLDGEVDATSLHEFFTEQEKAIGRGALNRQYNQIREEFGDNSLNELMNIMGLTVEEIFTPKETK